MLTHAPITARGWIKSDQMQSQANATQRGSKILVHFITVSVSHFDLIAILKKKGVRWSHFSPLHTNISQSRLYIFLR